MSIHITTNFWWPQQLAVYHTQECSMIAHKEIHKLWGGCFQIQDGWSPAQDLQHLRSWLKLFTSGTCWVAQALNVPCFSDSSASLDWYGGIGQLQENCHCLVTSFLQPNSVQSQMMLVGDAPRSESKNVYSTRQPCRYIQPQPLSTDSPASRLMQDISKEMVILKKLKWRPPCKWLYDPFSQEPTSVALRHPSNSSGVEWTCTLLLCITYIIYYDFTRFSSRNWWQETYNSGWYISRN